MSLSSSVFEDSTDIKARLGLSTYCAFHAMTLALLVLRFNLAVVALTSLRSESSIFDILLDGCSDVSGVTSSVSSDMIGRC